MSAPTMVCRGKSKRLACAFGSVGQSIQCTPRRSRNWDGPIERVCGVELRGE